MQKFSTRCKPKEIVTGGFVFLNCSEPAAVWVEWNAGGIRSLCKKHFDIYASIWPQEYHSYRVLSEKEVKMRTALE